MIFVVLYKTRTKLTRDHIAQPNKPFSGTKTIGVWWTLGRYDAVRVFEARDEKEAMKMSLALDGASSETLVAVDRAEAVKMLG